MSVTTTYFKLCLSCGLEGDIFCNVIAKPLCSIMFQLVEYVPTKLFSKLLSVITMDEYEITKIIKLLGISEKEFVIYRHLLSKGNLSVAKLSGNLSLPRATVYSNVDKLHTLGLIRYLNKDKIKILEASSPKTFEKILINKLFEVDQEILELVSVKTDLALVKEKNINSDNKSLTQSLRILKFSSRDIQVFFELSRVSGKTVAQISATSKIPRTSVIDSIERLLRKKCVKKVDDKIFAQSIKFVGTVADMQLELSSNKRSSLLSIRNDVRKLADFLLNDGSTLMDTTIEYFEGIHAVESVYDETMLASEINCFINVKRYYELFPNTRYKFVKALKDNPSRTFLSISVDSPTARYIRKTRTSKRYKSKFVGEEETFGKLDFHIFDDKIAIIELDKSHPAAVVINSPNIAKGLRAIHALLWDKLPKE